MFVASRERETRGGWPGHSFRRSVRRPALSRKFILAGAAAHVGLPPSPPPVSLGTQDPGGGGLSAEFIFLCFRCARPADFFSASPKDANA